ncbi:hypothetical protein NP493_621g02000 [Ridgeia piscesae]|uniref:Uncharacterized protein n=1 Tax=Ridgeia piscesae TaxID=27915 RepID=A0AAD9KT52_RIDPI|nr:hypothetical protein NP493_621g02000 [Ridgeia piscesae]
MCVDTGQCRPVVCQSRLSSDCEERNPWHQTMQAIVDALGKV